MNDLLTNNSANLVSVFSLFISVIALGISSLYIFKKRLQFQNAGIESINKDQFDVNRFSETLEKKERQISDLRFKLDLKKSFEDDLIKTISDVESKENFDSKKLAVELKQKLQNLNSIDNKQFTKNPSNLEDKDVFIKELERVHPELNYQERLLCFYFRMHLRSKEISVIEGITSGTVRVYKNKIKHKMGLTQEESLNEYLCNIATGKAA